MKVAQQQSVPLAVVSPASNGRTVFRAMSEATLAIRKVGD